MRQSVAAWFYAVVVSSFLFALLEVLQLARQSDWLGSASTGILDFALILVTYAGIAATLSLIPACSAYLLHKRNDSALTAAAVYVIALVVGGFVLTKSGEAVHLTTIIAASWLLTGLLISLLGNRFDAQWRLTFTAITILSLTAAAMAAHEIRYAAIASTDSTVFAVFAACAVALVTMFYACYTWARGRRRWTAVVRVIVVAFFVPMLARGYADYRGLFQTQSGPRVLIVTADTLRADYLSLYGGHVPTPHLERLAAEGAVFERSYALSSWTVPSICGLMSSRYPPSTTSDATDTQWKTDITFGFPEIAPYWTADDGRTIFGDLTHLGVPTAMFMANLAMLSHAWLVDDFKLARSTFSPDEQRRGILCNMPLLHAAVRTALPDVAPYGPYDTSALTRDYTRAYLRQHRHGPFVVWAHFLDPHAPYAPPARYQPDGVQVKIFPPDGRSVKKSFGAAPPDRESAKALYEGEIRYLDECIGAVIDCVDRLGLGDSTLVCFTSDHGEELWDHAEWGHGHSLYEELIRVPLIFRGPNVAPRRIATPVSAIHVLPTIVGWMGAGTRPRWRGTDLSPTLRDAAAPLPDETRFTGATFHFGVDAEPLEGMAWKQYKLIRGLRSGDIRLYDIDGDPGELRDVSVDNPAVVAEYIDLLDKWNESFPSRITDIWQRPDSTDDGDEVIDAFKALGYL